MHVHEKILRIALFALGGIMVYFAIRDDFLNWQTFEILVYIMEVVANAAFNFFHTFGVLEAVLHVFENTTNNAIVIKKHVAVGGCRWARLAD